MECTYDVDILHPIFRIAYNAAFPNSKSNTPCNYAYCDELKKYYFILSMTEDPGAILTVKCEVDVRMSFIKDNDFPVVVSRNQYKNKSNVPDKSFPVDPSFHIPKVIKYDDSIFIYHSGLYDTQPQSYDIVETI
jgi:hypothetical protein